MFLRNLAPLLLILFFTIACSNPEASGPIAAEWDLIETIGVPTARHEAALVGYKEKLYLIGGRRINAVDVYDPATNKWTAKSSTPIELHHFQAVVLEDVIYIVGAMTGAWPNEKPLEKVIAYYPEQDSFKVLHEIPKERRRGGAGAVVYNNKIYLVGGITNGHIDGTKNWLDVYDPKTGDWAALPDAPHLRDHFQAAIVRDKLYAFAGRRSRMRSNEPLALTTNLGDVFDLKAGVWLAPETTTAIPTPRAGTMTTGWDDLIIVGGGESDRQISAHNEVEAYDSRSNTWMTLPPLKQGRHGSGFVKIGDYLYTASGCGNAGGTPELVSLERINLTNLKLEKRSKTAKGDTVYQQWHTLTLSFTGPETSEQAIPNPFTDYLLQVTFRHKDAEYTIRGFYAADGNAAETGADSGAVWQARFAPDRVGVWSYEATLKKGPMIAIKDTNSAGIVVPLQKAKGTFIVEPSDKDHPDFREKGNLIADGQYFKFANTDDYWLKGGTNSPENFLGYAGFDGTYRIENNERDGEAAAGSALHTFSPHSIDWHTGDPDWQGGRGKNIIGAINYLASQGMNSVYFLTLNILGDGKDVWPYRSHEDFTRFDVSKLDQWEIVFSHMQQQGILLHIVTQETENELMLDGGETGPLRKLYYNELIARFAHHPALIWNLGEENGPVDWRPEGQTTQQRMAVVRYIKSHDPYNHPVILHTHAEAKDKDAILSPLLGFTKLEGLSFQVAERETINHETQKWLRLSKQSGNPWLIMMDEVGLWHTGAKTDADDPSHDTLRQHALWGALLGGSAGVEWYFGAHQPANDLTSEDWRLRENLWQQTSNALRFFETYLPYWKMKPCEPEEITPRTNYCFKLPGKIYVVYVPANTAPLLKSEELTGPFTLHWYDPVAGGALQSQSIINVDTSGKNRGHIILDQAPAPQRDWIALVRSQ